jgi:aminopeptidase N
MTQPTAKFRQDYQPPAFTITDIDLDILLDDHDTQVISTLKVKRLVADAPLVLDGEDLVLKQLLVDGAVYTDYQISDNQLTLTCIGETATITIETRLDPMANTALEGLYKSGGAFCTQCEAEGFRRITYYLDRPDVLAVFSTRITADKRDYPYLLGNGNPVAVGDLDNGRHWVQWQDPHPKPAYLFALVAGDFDRLQDTFVTQSGRDVVLEIFVDKGNLNRAGHAMNSLKAAMAWDEQRFNLEYDLDIYMIVAVDFFNMGAMENKGLNVFNSKFVLANRDTATDADFLAIEAVIGHEYFHNWTGNRVTCRDWFQLSLKEGLTVFRDQEFSSDLGSRAVNRINNVRLLRSHQFAEDAGPMAHPIRPDKVIEMNNFYTLTVYEKGAEVIRMLHTLLGEAAFQSGMALYFERFDGQAVTCDDFVQAMEDASGIDLDQFRLWYSQSGTPVLTMTQDYDSNAQTLCLRLAQQTPATADQHDKQPLHIPVDIELLDAQGQIIALQGCESLRTGSVLSLTQAEQTFEFTDIATAPTVSVLQEFSAPVRLLVDYSMAELLNLMAHASNTFCRWDAAQQLIAKIVRDNVGHLAQGEALSLPCEFVDALRGLLLDDAMDPAFVALMLSLPTVNEMIELFKPADIDAIAKVHHFLYTELARGLDDELMAILYLCEQRDQGQLEGEQIGWRSLKSELLRFIAYNSAAPIVDQYRANRSMTLNLAALKASNQAALAEHDELMADFEARWSHDGLVMDKWFALQATRSGSDALTRVKSLLEHPSFSMGNPNRVRSLIGSFANLNPVAFHERNGSGYQFLFEVLCQMNETNPQVASRLITPMIQFAHLDDARRALIKGHLESLIALPSLSKDLFEKVTKSLEQL